MINRYFNLNFIKTYYMKNKESKYTHFLCSLSLIHSKFKLKYLL